MAKFEYEFSNKDKDLVLRLYFILLYHKLHLI